MDDACGRFALLGGSRDGLSTVILERLTIPHAAADTGFKGKVWVWGVVNPTPNPKLV